MQASDVQVRCARHKNSDDENSQVAMGISSTGGGVYREPA